MGKAVRIALQLVAIALSLSIWAPAVHGGDPSVKLTALDGLNWTPDGGGRALHVLQIRVYVLTDRSRFSLGSYDDLWRKPGFLPADQVLSKLEDVEIVSKGKKTLKLSVPKDKLKQIRFLGIVAGYAAPESDQGWRQVLEIAGGKSKVQVVLGPRGMQPAHAK